MCVRTGPQCSPAVRSKGLIHESAPHDRDQTEDAREVQRLVSAMAFGSQGGVVFYVYVNVDPPRCRFMHAEDRGCCVCVYSYMMSHEHFYPVVLTEGLFRGQQQRGAMCPDVHPNAVARPLCLLSLIHI